MVKVVDSIMGSGKTSVAIQMMNDNPSKRYMYITPYLDEVTRIMNSCIGFEEPTKDPTKGDSLNQLIAAGKSIVSTHALFKSATKETMELLKKWDYTLIIDETVEVVSVEGFKKYDLPTVLGMGYGHVDPITGYLVWDEDSYDGSLNRIKMVCQTKSVVVVNGTALAWVLSEDIFNCFQETFVLSYMFDVQIIKYYFDIKSIQYERLQLVTNGGKYNLVPHDGSDGDRSQININLYTGKKNEIGTLGIVKKGKKGKIIKIDPYYNLSSTWYKKANRDILKRIKDNTGGYFKNDRKSPSNLTLWTVFKDYQVEIEEDGYKGGFAPWNQRATNKFMGTTNIAYLVNIFMHPMLKAFFESKGIEISREQEERYALSELLQFIFRSALRDGKPVHLYIPSSRMRHLLQEWLGLPIAD